VPGAGEVGGAEGVGVGEADVGDAGVGPAAAAVVAAELGEPVGDGEPVAPPVPLDEGVGLGLVVALPPGEGEIFWPRLPVVQVVDGEGVTDPPRPGPTRWPVGPLFADREEPGPCGGTVRPG
jgi:hypothetical protein